MATNNPRPSQPPPYDYIIVGSGAGGAPLASRLARAGKRVLVIEAGSNHTQKGPLDPGNEVTRVPSTHAASSEHPDLSWRFFVDHYQRKPNGELPDGIPEDPKWHRHNADRGEDASHDGILYPRAAGIGGCTIHNAMITIAGPESDWDDLASYLGDPSWSGRQMRAYFQKLEHNDYHPAPNRARRSITNATWHFVKESVQFLFGRRPDMTGGKHGFEGWLHTSFTDLSLGLQDKQILKMIKAALWTSKRSGLEHTWYWARTFFRGRFRRSLDPNHGETQSSSPEGIALIPLAVYGGDTTIHQNRSTPYSMRGRRSSPRELLLETLALYPDNLTIWTDCLVTEVILSKDESPRAVGVKLSRGERLYRAHVKPNEEGGETESVHVGPGGEVILCGGTFNTPQLLMLSGIGRPDADGNIAFAEDHDPDAPKPKKRDKKKIKCRVHSPGVGSNMQDRYEVSVVSEMKKDFSLLDGAEFKIPHDPADADRHLRRWREEGTGLYTSNGGVLAILKRSRPELPQPDLFIFGVPSRFRGYEVGYSDIVRHNLFTWVVLKSHTKNRGGTVQLRSADPRDTPKINFNYFGTGDPDRAKGQSSHDPDVQAIAEGVKFIRNVLTSAKSIVKSEAHPGAAVSSDAAINEWIRRDAWGHHACGTCRMGPDGDEGAVLDSRFCVRGVDNLRVVDASIFPNIPGYFIVTNIYMASEKAADIILEDADSQHSRDTPEYPRELQDLEASALKQRRDLAGVYATANADSDGAELSATPQGPVASEGETKLDADGKSDSPPAPTGAPSDVLEGQEWSDDVTGLALSGGGIRSATLCLGVLQSLAGHRALRRIDFLSTVSGGGYIGSSLGRFYDRLRPDREPRSAATSPVPPADHIEHDLVTPNSAFLDWLRSHGNYIAPGGKGDGRSNAAIFVRNLLSVHLIVGVALFLTFCLANAVRFGLLDQALAGKGLLFDRSALPLGDFFASTVGPWFSPWFILVELLWWFLAFPRILAYWIVSEDRHETFNWVPLTLLFVIATALLLAGVSDGLWASPILIGTAMLSSLIHVELAWRRGHQREASVGTGGNATQRARTRNYLTYDLGLALALLGAALAFFAIDTLAFGLQEWTLRSNRTYARSFAELGAVIALLTPLARRLADLLRSREGTGVSALLRFLKRDIFAGLLALVLLTLVAVLYAFASHAAFQGGTTLARGLIATVVAAVLTFIFALPPSWSFVNRSSLAQPYAARLARAYLGASNPARHRPDGINITEVIPGDDVASIRDYQPHQASGPLHLINLTINQTVDYGSRLSKRDRQGTNMSVSCFGATVGTQWHGVWTDASEAGQSEKKSARAGLKPVADKRGLPHPFKDLLERAADRAEMLSLRQWMAISGAAVDPGRGRGTNLGASLLMGLVNLRTGHWWDSGIAESARVGFPVASPIRRILYLIPRFLTTQSLLLSEWLAKFPGPWRRFWHVSDGGFFENLGVYELVRRRVPRMIVCDGGCDPDYEFSDFSELVRKVRIDFDVKIESFNQVELDSLELPAEIRKCVGTLDNLRPIPSDDECKRQSEVHAALCWVHYPVTPADRFLDEFKGATEGDPEDLPTSKAPRRSVLLLMKSSLTGDEPEDIRNYCLGHQDFPHETTSDQFFDESQWESYRKLGEHLSDPLFAKDWFWNIPLPPSDGGPA